MHDDAPFGHEQFPRRGGWATSPKFLPTTVLTSDQLLKVSCFLDALDESGAYFAGTVKFDGHSFEVGFNTASEEHFVRIQ